MMSNSTTCPGALRLTPLWWRSVAGATLLTIAVSALVGACGGGGGGGSAPPTQPPPTPPPVANVSYSSDASAINDSLSWTTSVTGQQITFTLRATNVTNLNGIAFDLVYPGAQLTYESASELTAFSGGGSTSSSVFHQTGRLVIGLARLGSAGGFGGSGDLLTIIFTSAASGTGRIDFENRQAVRADGGAIGTLDWIGGSLTVN